jgi:peptidyl-prolyl cis-trans isomerase A (cyclophilin A)
LNPPLISAKRIASSHQREDRMMIFAKPPLTLAYRRARWLDALAVCAVLTSPVAAFAASPAKPKPAPAKPAPPPAPLVRVGLTTAMGVIVLELDRARAPISTGNFLRYVDQRRFDGTVFYRVMRLGTDAKGAPQGLIQGGTRGDPKRVLKPIAHEPTSQTSIRHEAGAISMARFAPGTATGDFSLLLSSMPGLDANPEASGDKDGYAAFGRVVEGMDVVRKIYDAPLSPTLGEGFLKGQMIAAPIRIVSARRVAMPPAPPVHIAPGKPSE